MVSNNPEVYLLDTNIASAAWNVRHSAHTVVIDKLRQLGLARIFISCVTIAEIEFGLQVTPQIDADKQRIVRSNMDSYEPLRIDKHTAKEYARIRASLFRQFWPKSRSLKFRYIEDLVDEVTGKSLGIQENDLWIVSVAVQYNCILVTGDRASGMQRIVDVAQYQGRTQYWPMKRQP